MNQESCETALLACKRHWFKSILIAGAMIALFGALSTQVSAQAKQNYPLGAGQVQKLIQLQVPDAAIGAEIRRRGLNFAPGKETVEALRRMGAGPETLQAIDELRPMMDEAKKEIPVVLTKLYQSLDQGNPLAVRQFLSAEIANNAHQLDSICRPFTYRAHYIEAVIERPGQMFEVRVRVLFKPFDEKAQVLTFHPNAGTFLLVQTNDAGDDWFGSEKEAAIQIARNFIYAAKGQKADVLAGLVAPGLDVSRYISDPCWRESFQLVVEVTDLHASLDAHMGLKVRVHATVPVRGVAQMTTQQQADFWFDQVNDQYKIVVANPLHDPAMYYGPPDSCRHVGDGFFAPIEAQNLEDATLRRFGLPISSEAEHGQVYRVGGDVMAPVALSKPQDASCTDAARKIRARGKEQLKFVVDVNGYVKDITVTKSLEPSLDESAIRALQKLTFQPATRLGVPVPVTMGFEVEFECN